MMPILDIEFIAQSLGQSSKVANLAIAAFQIDSRQVGEGDVFVALKGEQADGHQFIDKALAQGAALVLANAGFAHADARVICVEDTEKALAVIAKAWREVVNPQVFGITGSTGKTSVKEMLAAIMREAHGEDAVLATAGNFNNHLGLPLTLLRMSAATKVAVIEMGMNHFGELDYLTHIAKPDFALVNNAMRAHIGCGFNDVSDIARAKSEIYAGVKTGGFAFLPMDDEQLPIFQAATSQQNQIGFGLNQGQYHTAHVQLSPLSSQFELITPDVQFKIALSVAGLHNVKNAVAASSMALQSGVSPEYIQSALSKFTNIKGRLQLKMGLLGAKVIDDTYNANPDSMKAALDVLAQFDAPRILVMGDLGELGETAPQLHGEVGAYAQELGIEKAYFLGELCSHAAQHCAGSEHFLNKAELIEALKSQLSAKTTVLVKGSRFMKMEEIVAAIIEQVNEA